MAGAGHSIRGETLTRAMCVREWPFLLLMNTMRAQSQERSQSTNKSIAGEGAVAPLMALIRTATRWQQELGP